MTMTQFGWIAKAADSTSTAAINGRTVFTSPQIKGSKINQIIIAYRFGFGKDQAINQNL